MARSGNAAEGAANPGQVVWIQGLIRKLNQLGCKLWLEWVPGHVGLEQNELCDRMAREAAARSRSHPRTDPPPLAKGETSAFLDALAKVTYWDY